NDFHKPAFLFMALVNEALLLGDFLGEEWEIALRARLLNWFIPKGESAFWPLVTAEKDSAVAGLLLSYFAVLTKRTMNAQCDGLGGLTLWIGAARQEFSKFPALNQHQT